MRTHRINSATVNRTTEAASFAPYVAKRADVDFQYSIDLVAAHEREEEQAMAVLAGIKARLETARKELYTDMMRRAGLKNINAGISDYVREVNGDKA